jgi:hypothetical protein
VELLHADSLAPEPGERVFRHGRIAPLFVLALLAAPACLALFVAGVRVSARGLPWYGWVVGAPLALVLGGLYLLILSAAAQVARRAWLPSNWSVRLAPSLLVLNLRSYQNAHFPHDGPTVARLALREIARVREVPDVTPSAEPESPSTRRRWLELELASVDTTVLERILRAERERPGPATRVLGVKSRTRFHHVTVQLHAPGVLRIEWLGKPLVRALAAAGLPLGERRDVDLAKTHGPDLDAHLAELVHRGDRMAAITLARAELGLSLHAARERIARIGREAA